MLDAGYSKSAAKQQSSILAAIKTKKVFSSIIDQLKNKRDEAIRQLTKKKLTKTNAKDLTDIIDKLTKNIQLLDGKPTENVNLMGNF